MNLVDTSVWIDWFRDHDSWQAQRLDGWLDTGEARVCPVVFQEVLQGAANPAAWRTLNERFRAMPRLDIADAFALHARAAELYANARWRGFTIRSPNDCLIAATAIMADVPLLHDDADFERIAQIEPALRLVKGTDL